MKLLTTRDRGFLLVFALLSAFLWLRDRSWAGSASDTLPILAGFPLFVYLGGPWHLRKDPLPLTPASVLGAVALFMLGLSLEANLLLALSMAFLTESYLRTRLEPQALTRARALLPLLVLAYPWLVLDGQPLTWWFRLTGAGATAHVFSLLGLAVAQEGVHLTIQGLQVSVDPACSGLNVLQAALLSGLAVAVRNERVQRLQDAFPALLALVALAWLANVTRILMLCVIALTFGADFARGPVHASGGLLVLVLMFVLTLKLFARRKEPRT